jgi:hypothetical protein
VQRPEGGLGSQAKWFICRHSSPESRLQEAMRREEGHLVVLQIKHFARSLHSSQVGKNPTEGPTIGLVKALGHANLGQCPFQMYWLLSS